MGVTAAVVAIAGTTYAVSEQNKAGRLSRAAAATQQKAQQTKVARERRIAARQNVLNTARAQANAQAAGTLQSSGYSGGIGASQSQAGANTGYGTQMSGLSSRASIFSGQAAQANVNSSLGFKVAGMAVSAGGGFGKIKTDIKALGNPNKYFS